MPLNVVWDFLVQGSVALVDKDSIHSIKWVLLPEQKEGMVLTAKNRQRYIYDRDDD